MSKHIICTEELPQGGIGASLKLTFHEYLPEGVEPINYQLPSLPKEQAQLERAYIQASLHAGELPGMLVCNHLIKLLNEAAKENRILKPITIVPYANPIGLNQLLLGKHHGRFSLLTGVNFNRSWFDVTRAVEKKLQEKQIETVTEEAEKVLLVRQAIYEAAYELKSNQLEVVMKQQLYKRASSSQIVLDLHCDFNAVLYMFTHTKLWPQMADLCHFLDTKCSILSSNSGGNAFDESCSEIWENLQTRNPTWQLPMGCQASTIELRGEYDVSDELASVDARNLYRWLQHRGFIQQTETEAPMTMTKEDVELMRVVPLNGVDFIEATVPGVIVWKVSVGEMVTKGQLLGEIVNIQEAEADRTPIIARNDGFVFGRDNMQLAVPGEIMIDIAGTEPLEWRNNAYPYAK